MKSVSICTSDRPELVKQFLKSLQSNNTEGWHLFVSGDIQCKEVEELINQIKFMPLTSWNNGTRMGPDGNTFTVCFSAIERHGATSNLYVDDDIILSPDALDLCNWYLDQPLSKDVEKNCGLCLCNDASNPERPNSISPNETWRGLVGQGYFYTRDQWMNFVKPNFWQSDPSWDGQGYDWSLGYQAPKLGKTILRPRLSRSQHIGTYGHHSPGRVFPENYALEKSTGFVIENE